MVTHFLTCDQCKAEIAVPEIETLQYRSKVCDNCGAELIFQNSELREGRITTLIRCHNPLCAAYEKPIEALLTRADLKEACEPDANVLLRECHTCGEAIRFTSQEKVGMREMLA
jgi:hypothetical protein